MSKIRVLGTIEARMGSSRLPGKTLKEVSEGLTLLELVHSRFKLCKNVDEVCVATSFSPADDEIVKFCRSKNILVQRGNETDVLSRVINAGLVFAPEVLVQMGGDSAYLDFVLIDRLIEIYFKESAAYDYVCNDLDRAYPIGIYGHIVNFKTLLEMNQKRDLTEIEREDVVRHFWNASEKYKILNVKVSSEYAHPELRLTIDYPEDFALIRQVMKHFKRTNFTFQDVILLKNERPALFEPVLKLVQKSLPPQNVKFESCELFS